MTEIKDDALDGSICPVGRDSSFPPRDDEPLDPLSYRVEPTHCSFAYNVKT